jgi:rare lipoprotein A
MTRIYSLVLLILVIFLSACSSRKSARIPSKPRVVQVQDGMASIYRDHRTASGEPYLSRAMVAAHRTWPMGTMVRVTHLHTGQSAIVRINDRGPYIRGRVIDLTPAAASAIGLTPRHGICKVRLERLQR